MRRLGQAAGPFELKFSDEENMKQDFVHFIQIDGEFFKVKNLSSITFRLAQNLPEGSLTMLERNEAPTDWLLLKIFFSIKSNFFTISLK